MKIKKLIISFLLLNFLSTQVMALELDTSIDEEIRKNYNPNKLEEDMGLPPLPKDLDEASGLSQQVKPVSSSVKASSKNNPSNVTSKASSGANSVAKKSSAAVNNANQKSAVNVNNKVQLSKVSKTANSSKYNYAILKKGTKIKVRALNAVSDKSRKGYRIKFVSLYPVTTTYYTIPMGTVFYGQISNSHAPQFTANGGLIQINVNSIILSGNVQPISGKITKANHKKIFFNNIKGKRKYLLSMFNSTKHSRHFYHKMMRVTKKLAKDGSSIILTPFPIIAGVGAVAGNALISPVLAIPYKGGSISINAGSEFQIKLLEDTYLYR